MAGVICLRKKERRPLMDNISSRKWKAFVMNDVFDIKATKSSIDKKNLVNVVGTIPYVTRTDKNNGIDMFIGEQPQYEMDEGNVLTIGLDTQTIFYQPMPFYTGQNIQVIRHPKLNRYNASFLILAIKILLQKFNWGGNGATLTRLKRSKIFLPITDNQKIDWNFMEEYMREKEVKLLESAIDNLRKRLVVKNMIDEGKLLHTQWKAFFLEDVVTISSGRDIYERERIEGDIPYITATASNNGIGYFVANTNETLETGCLSVNRNGSVGYCFYHPYKALYGNDTRKLKLKKLNKYISLFISMSVTKQRDKYGYGYKMGTGRLKRQKILLPIDADEYPDWEYMENYMRNVESQQILQYLTILNRL